MCTNYFLYLQFLRCKITLLKLITPNQEFRSSCFVLYTLRQFSAQCLCRIRTIHCLCWATDRVTWLVCSGQLITRTYNLVPRRSLLPVVRVKSWKRWARFSRWRHRAKVDYRSNPASTLRDYRVACLCRAKAAHCNIHLKLRMCGAKNLTTAICNLFALEFCVIAINVNQKHTMRFQ